MRGWPIAVLALLQACIGTAGTNELSKDYSAATVVAATARLHESADSKWPKHLMREGSSRGPTDFNPAAYFDVLKHLSQPEGYVLDYVYWYAHGNGRPFLYLRTTNAPPFKTHAEYESALGGQEATDQARKQLCTRLRLDGSAESFFEQYVFDELAGQFYLAWHANYNDTTIVTSGDDIERIIRSIDKSDFGRPLTEDQKAAAREADLSPRVIWLNNDIAQVSIVFFSKWMGLYRITRNVARNHPHTVEKISVEKLMKYDCGMMF